MIKKKVQNRTPTEGSALGRSLLRGLDERGELKVCVEVYDVPSAVDVGKILGRTPSTEQHCSHSGQAD
jgi:hypothetical protein